MVEHEKSKYFTPDTEDIRVGYECEVFTNKEIEKFDKGEWKPYAVGTNIIDVILKDKDLSKTIRVPYLTKEQIEADGWNYAIGKNRLYQKDATVDLLNDHTIVISQNQMVSFCGECKDINTFRYITKLLGIQ